MPTVETTHLCNIEAEKRLLGYLLFENCLDELLSKVPLSSKCFTFRAFRVIWEALSYLHSNGKQSDLMTLMMRISECGLKNIVTEEIIQELLDVSSLGLNILKPEQAIAHAEEIYKYSQQREFINLLTDCAERLSSARGSYEEEKIDVANKLNDFLGNFSLDKKQTLRYLDETIKDVVLEIIKCMGEEDQPIEGVKSNLIDLDALIASFKPRQSIIVAARPSMGKCLGIDTEIIMYDGSVKKVQDIKPGDQLMGPDSTPRNVLSTCQGEEMMYWIHQNHAMSYRVNESHILSLEYSGDNGRTKDGDVFNISVKDWLKESQRFKTRAKGYKRGWELPSQSIPIDPYLLGVWLGDGSYDKAIVHNPDIEIQQEIAEIATSSGYSSRICTPRNRCEYVSITNGFLADLRENKLLGHKHIPDCYLQNSQEIRLQLLAGLLDTD